MAPLLGCSPAATATSASAAPTTASRASVADGASPAMASSAAASRFVSAPGASACVQQHNGWGQGRVHTSSVLLCFETRVSAKVSGVENEVLQSIKM